MIRGAWSYWWPYTPDPRSAFTDLCNSVFRQGDFLWPRGKRPASVAALRKRADHLTETILDLKELGASRGPNVVSPLSADQLDALFGTAAPSREMVESQLQLLVQIRPRGEGGYLVTYEAGEPTELAFFGRSP